ncbi:tubulin polyglutamylase like protein [Babesia gibsoni]|uniref:Tubulin polyglutamylase like protein n=1 Tax=Babesia gibsoni TaxID=33632 RepID=A0AAD8PGG7_BABGI|nr:tubulin polyglutamylase like protein [Babesia gibsoni]
MSNSDRRNQKLHMWPPHLYPAINRIASERVKEHPQSPLRSMSVSIDRRAKSERSHASRRTLSVTSNEEKEIRRTISCIIALMDSFGAAKKAGRDSDDRSTCDSSSCSLENKDKCTLLSLLSSRLSEIRRMQLPKYVSAPEMTSAITDVSADNRSYTNSNHTHVESETTKHNVTGEKTNPCNGIPPFTATPQVDGGRRNTSSVAFYKRPIVNIAFARTDVSVVAAATKRLRWGTCESNFGGDIFWFSNCLEGTCSKEQIRVFFGITYSKITLNRFNNLQGATRKILFACLTEIYERYTKSDPHLYSTVTSPVTYLFPRDANKMMKALKSGIPMILKPSYGSMGNGIKVVPSIEKVPPSILRGNNNYVCQVYVDRPMLIDARKFDFRVYVLITNIGGGFAAFLSTLGLARVCIHPYQRPNNKNCNDTFMHLTNYSINRQHKRFQRSIDIADDTSNKRTLTSALGSLQQAYGIESQELWSQMARLSEAAVSILYPSIQIHSHNEDFHSFQIIGLDMLLDENAKMWLLEVNSNPSLHYTYQEDDRIKPDVVDQHVKVSLVSESLKLIHRIRCGGVNEIEPEMWIELRVRIPPEIGITTALYAEYRGMFQKEEMQCDDWIHFCKTNGLIALLRDSMDNPGAKSDCKKKVTLKDARLLIRDTFVRTHSRARSQGFPEFLSHMESLAMNIFRKSIHKVIETMCTSGKTHLQYSEQQLVARDHHNLVPAACLHMLLEQAHFFTDFRDKDAI